MDLHDALIRTHRNNLRRYRRLLAGHLAELERAYIHRRIDEEEELLHILQCNRLEDGPLTARPSAPDRGEIPHMRVNSMTTRTKGESHGYA